MNQSIQTQQTFRILAIAASPAASLAVLSVASVLGIEPQQAADRLASLPSVLAEHVAASEGPRLSAVLAALGLTVRLDPSFSKMTLPPARRLDLSVHCLEPARGLDVATRLATLTDRDAAMIHSEINGPGGFVLRGLSEKRRLAIMASFRRNHAVRVVSADALTSVYDAFAMPGHSGPFAEISRLGLGPNAFSGALAANMNHATARHLERRTNAGLMIVNRAFQRFDLVLRAAPGIATRDLDAFLAVRRLGGTAHSLDGHRRLEIGLSFREAQQFSADYVGMGCDVAAVLRGLHQPSPVA